MKRQRWLHATTDDPLALVKRALRKVQEAIDADDDIGVREAAELGWLALSSTADVVADRLGRPLPGGFTSRRAAFAELEKVAGLKRYRLVKTFDIAKLLLHGECFHADRCQPGTVLAFIKDDVSQAVDLALLWSGSPKARKHRR